MNRKEIIDSLNDKFVKHFGELNNDLNKHLVKVRPIFKDDCSFFEVPVLVNICDVKDVTLPGNKSLAFMLKPPTNNKWETKLIPTNPAIIRSITDWYWCEKAAASDSFFKYIFSNNINNLISTLNNALDIYSSDLCFGEVRATFQRPVGMDIFFSELESDNGLELRLYSNCVSFEKVIS